MNIVLVAEESAGIQTLRLLSLLEDYKVAAVLTSEGEEKGSSVANVAKFFNYDVLPTDLVTSPKFAGWMKMQSIDILLNVHALHVIHPEVLEAARIGAFNLHPGPLPKYSGLNAPGWAIFNEETSHAVTLHWISPGIDTGDIAYESSFEITPKDTALTVSAKCVEDGMSLVTQLLTDIHINPHSVPRIPQDLNNRKFYKRNQIPCDGILDWNQPARKIDAFVRACDYYPFKSPWGHPRTSVGTKNLGIVKTSLSNISSDEYPGSVQLIEGKSAVATADEWLYIDRCCYVEKYYTGDKVLKPGYKLGKYKINHYSDSIDTQYVNKYNKTVSLDNEI